MRSLTILALLISVLALPAVASAKTPLRVIQLGSLPSVPTYGTTNAHVYLPDGATAAYVRAYGSGLSLDAQAMCHGRVSFTKLPSLVSGRVYRLQMPFCGTGGARFVLARVNGSGQVRLEILA